METRVQCVGCKRFSLQPRQAEEGNERLREWDRSYAAIGWGRCSMSAGLSMLWYPADTLRYCDWYQELAADLVQKRRIWIATQKEAA
ncbi:hypothetical protein [Cupriavidus sp. UGS-1]|uniref:hypothetical protein n=1 Tax=Cupriavidus sp. UGS-1 TaxID=2899826 RepID=UPI001E5C34E0|nr:hypothetical protein [Cupriavidus sp. UGS-1]MCD9124014.1 hypothetical protein [Cupriavidus sp. UGS-1]